ncbi:hypothetical protein TNCV_951531 [Trichonephila clavipes]|nr:hypothetical protein TNCV_951531 [Trichonephila clavipes]
MDLAAKISLYFSTVNLPFRVTIDPAENQDMAAHIMADPSPCFTIGRRQSLSYAYANVLQLCTHPVVKKSEKDDSSNHISFFLLSIDQVL